MSEKIKQQHLERAAYVYIRQSSIYQVRHHQEGRQRQYDLRSRAQQLGFAKVTVIDEDLGRSGAGHQERPGFGRLLAAVCQGVVGAVFALEASRLARNNRDWHHLVDLCALTETLLIDDDGVYDPRQMNDRLLLGLKGSMAEFELGLLRQRAREAFEQKVGRGFALWELPVGFVRTEEDRIEKTPDRQVQQAVESVFKKFRELGSARQVALWYHEEQIRVPQVQRGTGGREIFWQLPTSGRIRQMLRNPCYAGAFAYGRTATKTVIADGRARQASRQKKPQEQWKVLILAQHAGYISWEEYLQNQRQLEANVAFKDRPSGGAAKGGPAMLAGLLRCGRCGRKLQVAYSGANGRVPRYVCRGGRVDRGSGSCLTVGGLRVDDAVVGRVIEALQPVGIEAALRMTDRARAEDDDKRQALTLALERARYEANRARRQFDAAEPENRLVTSELEARWNGALIQVSELESRLQTMGNPLAPFTAQQKELLLDLGSDLEALWNYPDASVELKKRILRTVLHEIVINRKENPSEHVLQLHWTGGVHTELRVPRNKPGQHRNSADREIIDLVRELAKICTDKSIAAILNRLGYQTGTGKSWRAVRVANFRGYHDIPVFEAQGNWITLEQAARELGVSNTVVQRLLNDGILPATHVIEYAPWVIERKNLQLGRVQAEIKAVRKGRRIPRTAPEQDALALE